MSLPSSSIEGFGLMMGSSLGEIVPSGLSVSVVSISVGGSGIEEDSSFFDSIFRCAF